MIKITLSRKLGELRIKQVELSRITGIRNHSPLNASSSSRRALSRSLKRSLPFS